MTFDPLIFTGDYLRVRAIPTCHTSTFIWCHGKGQKGGNWQFMVEPLRKLGHCNHIAFIFPYLDYNTDSHKNEALVQKIVHEEIAKGCDPGRIAVGGYNEGFDVALRATLADSNKIGGVWGVTDGWDIPDALKELRKPTNAKTPVSIVDRSKPDASEKALIGLGQATGTIRAGSKNVKTAPQVVTDEVCANHPKPDAKPADRNVRNLPYWTDSSTGIYPWRLFKDRKSCPGVASFSQEA